MKITAVIPTKDRAADLVRAIESITCQTRLPDELIVIDQSADTQAKDAVASLIAHLDCGINLVYIHDNRIAGLVEAKAAAVSLSHGDVVMFLEDDVVLEKEYVARLAQGFVDKPDMMGCCGVIAEVAIAGPVYRAIFHLFHRGIFFDKRVDIHGQLTDVHDTFIQSAFLSGGVSAYRRVVFERVKFDTVNGFFMLEDIDFSTRAVREFGRERFFINTSARLAHLMSPVNRARLRPRYQRKLREFICFYKKNKDRNGALPSLLWLLVGLGIEAVVAAARSRHLGPISGYFSGILDGIQWKIKPVQATQYVRHS